MKETKTTKAAGAMIIIALSIWFVYLAQGILIPLILGFLLAVLILPLVRFLSQRLLFPNLLAVTLSLLLFFGLLGGIVLLMSAQIASFFKDLPEITQNLQTHWVNVQAWIQATFQLSWQEQENLIKNTVHSSQVILPKSVQSLSSLTELLMNFVLVPIYTFLILMYRRLFVQFFHRLASHNRQATVHEILVDINDVIRSYIGGLLIEMIIVALMTGFGMWLIGVKYFVFLGLLTALLNLIPYIGILVATIVSLLLTLVGSTDLTLLIGVVAVTAIVQFIDNNILIPKIVGSKVSINALASMLAVIFGGALAGVGGMFLALPILAILKVVFDHIPSLTAYGYLLGDDIPEGPKWMDRVGQAIRSWKRKNAG